jgi:hypothetical protein
MAFVYEFIPESDYCRFSSLSDYRQETLKKKYQLWAIDRERDIFIIFLVARKFVHHTDIIEGRIEDYRQPRYFLMCNKGNFLGLEYRDGPEVAARREENKIFDGIIYLKEVHLFIRNELKEYVNEYTAFIQETMKEYWNVRKFYDISNTSYTAMKKVNRNPDEKITMVNKIHIHAPLKVTWLDDSNIL